MNKYLFAFGLSFFVLFGANSVYASSDSVADSVLGQIVLQVEENGEAWYIDPSDKTRYYLGRGDGAVRVLSNRRVDISEQDFAKLKSGKDKDIIAKYLGRIVSSPDELGRLYYLSPGNNKLYGLSDWSDTYKMMRDVGVGITTKDLNTITVATASKTSPTFDDEYRGGVLPSRYQKGMTLKNVSNSVLAHYWTEKINNVRRGMGENEIHANQMLVDTATEWATEIGENRNPTNDRENNQVVHDWIATRLLANGVNEINDRYFLEQIGWTVVDDSIKGGYDAIDAIFEKYMEDSTSPGGYNPIHASAWDSIGVGFNFQKTHDDKIMMYMVSHIANLHD